MRKIKALEEHRFSTIKLLEITLPGLADYGSSTKKLSTEEGWPAGDNETKDTMQWKGQEWITGSPTPNSGSEQAIEAEPNNQNNADTDQSSEDIVDVSNISSHHSPVPITQKDIRQNIYVSAGRDRVAIVGAPINFEAIVFYEDGRKQLGGVIFTGLLGMAQPAGDM